MKSKADNSQVDFRPHFKTHQSLQIGNLYRELGVSMITVSSVDMANYFADDGWNNITIAFSLNILQINEINLLNKKINLHLLVESYEAVDFLEKHIQSGINIWIKYDSGLGRTGLSDSQSIIQLAKKISSIPKLTFRGLLTHAGHGYHREINKKHQVFNETLTLMTEIKEQLMESGILNVKLSYGDTPTCSVIDDFSGFDEIRPGNFAYYDINQMKLGSCTEEDIACSVICPIVALHKDRSEVIIYGGAVHFSKGIIPDSPKFFGYVVGVNETRWQKINFDFYLSAVSQEHGVVKVPKDIFSQLQIGDLLQFYPIHNALTADLLKSQTIIE
jgi:D-serine deaminase-like pyridoxal phosphate-dependent protein